jgi:drug/metabolite transporter (DMT)-like permease
MPKTVYLQLHLLVGLFATTAIFGHLVSLAALELVVWRSALAALGAAAVVAALGRRRLFPGLRNLGALLGIGMIVGIHWVFFFAAIKVSNISICLAGMATASFFTAFTEPFFERRRVRPLEVVLGMAVLAGIVLVAGFERGNLLGLGLAVVSAFLAAVFPVFNRGLIRRAEFDPLVMVVWEMAGACLVCLAVLPIFGGMAAYAGLAKWQGLDWVWLLLLAWLCTVFAHAYHIHLLRYLSAYTSNLAINFEPVYGILAAAVLFGEHRDLHPGFYVGTAAIIAANILHPLILRHVARRKALVV